jgi:hypothetical protein
MPCTRFLRYRANQKKNKKHKPRYHPRKDELININGRDGVIEQKVTQPKAQGAFQLYCI